MVTVIKTYVYCLVLVAGNLLLKNADFQLVKGFYDHTFSCNSLKICTSNIARIAVCTKFTSLEIACAGHNREREELLLLQRNCFM